MESFRVYLEKWKLNFDPWKEEIREKPIWVEMYNLPVEFWEEDILRDFGKSIGNLKQMDGIMIDRRLGTYARMCPNVLPSSSIPQEIEIHREWGIW
ncbi:hypothetical protein SUGI_0261350 [Cryptomeria japonica]|nr:hypothetical protein SUGI_0261350 [Cryptomeria japonica]